MSEIGPFVRPYMRPRFPAEGNCQISNSGLRLQPICSCLGLVSLRSPAAVSPENEQRFRAAHPATDRSYAEACERQPPQLSIFGLRPW
jgi:hypothetical protein